VSVTQVANLQRCLFEIVVLVFEVLICRKGVSVFCNSGKINGNLGIIRNISVMCNLLTYFMIPYIVANTYQIVYTPIR